MFFVIYHIISNLVLHFSGGLNRLDSSSRDGERGYFKYGNHGSRNGGHYKTSNRGCGKLLIKLIILVSRNIDFF